MKSLTNTCCNKCFTAKRDVLTSARTTGCGDNVCPCHTPYSTEGWEERFSQKWLGANNYELDCAVSSPVMKEMLEDIRTLLTQRDREVVDLVLNAGDNKISMRGDIECDVCHQGFTGTYWISQNDLKQKLISKQNDI